MRRLAPSVAFLLVSACASSGAPDGVRGRTSTVQMSVGAVGNGAAAVDGTATVTTSTADESLAASPAQVWQALPGVLLELGIPATQASEPTRTLTAQNLRVSRIGGRRLSAFFRCGGAYGDNADGGNTVVQVRLQVLPAAGESESRLRTEVRAAAGASGQVTAGECGSTGALESLISRSLREKLAPGA